MGGIGRSWDPATVSALVAVSGSFVGGFAFNFKCVLTQRHHDRKDLLAKKIAHREQLVSDFISEGARVGQRDDPQREFSNICRRELESLRSVL
jgi:hypothetical protein